MNKKIAKIVLIVFINILFISLILCCIDFLIYTKFKNKYINSFEHADIFPPISYSDNYKIDFSPQSYNFLTKNIPSFRRTITKYEEKKAILIFGCSFAYGFGLTNKETVSNKLSEYTQRTVYNFAIPATGIQHMLELIKNPDLYKELSLPEHMIYVYIPGQMKRLRADIFPGPLDTNGINLKYELKNNKLKLVKSPLNIFSKTFIIKSLLYQKDLKRNNSSIENKNYNALLAKAIFNESKKILEAKYPGIKFTILRYETEGDEAEYLELEEMWNDLEKDGFSVIKSSDLIGRKYKYHSKDTNIDDYHPSAYAFDILIPPLAEKLNL